MPRNLIDLGDGRRADGQDGSRSCSNLSPAGVLDNVDRDLLLLCSGAELYHFLHCEGARQYRDSGPHMSLSAAAEKSRLRDSSADCSLEQGPVRKCQRCIDKGTAEFVDGKNLVGKKLVDGITQCPRNPKHPRPQILCRAVP